MQLYEELWKEYLEESRANRDTSVAARAWTKEIIWTIKNDVFPMVKKEIVENKKDIRSANFVWMHDDMDSMAWQYMPKRLTFIDKVTLRIMIAPSYLSELNRSFYIGGYFLNRDREVRIDINLYYWETTYERMIERWLNSDMVNDIYSLFAHEFYHAVDRDRADILSYETIDSDDVLGYLTQDEEARAFTNQLYLMAKRKRIPFRGYLENWLGGYVHSQLYVHHPEIFNNLEELHKIIKTVRDKIYATAVEMGYIR